jgi:hypothetical protein
LRRMAVQNVLPVTRDEHLRTINHISPAT